MPPPRTSASQDRPPTPENIQRKQMQLDQPLNEPGPSKPPQRKCQPAALPPPRERSTRIRTIPARYTESHIYRKKHPVEVEKDILRQRDWKKVVGEESSRPCQQNIPGGVPVPDSVPYYCHDFHWFSPLFLLSPKRPLIQTLLNHDMFPHSLSYLISCPISFTLSFIFFRSFRLEGKLGHLGLLGLETFGPWEDSTEDYLFWSDVYIPYMSRGYARTYCCPTRGIVLGFSGVGMVGMKGVVGGSEGRRGE